MRSLTVVSLLLAVAFCAGAAPPLHAQDPAAVQTEINAMEARQKEITSTLDYFQSLIKGLDQGTLLMISDPNGHFSAPVSKAVAEGYLEAQVALGKMKAETQAKKLADFHALTLQMAKEARQTVTELEHSQEKTKGLLSYLYTERARLKDTTDFTGTWSVTSQNQWDTTENRWDLKPDGAGRWKGTNTLLHSTNPAHAPLLNQVEEGVVLIADGPGKLRYTREGGDPNPANPGHYTQDGTGTYDVADANSFSIEATHHGSQATFKFTMKGTREKLK